MICGGDCCPLVNRVVGALLEEGDLNPNEVLHFLYNIMPSTLCRTRGRLL